jgi:putative flippase GtrA
MAETDEDRPGGAEDGYVPRHESKAQRLDRNYGELLQELRVVQTGVQILFAFLLTLAFTDRFTHVSAFQRGTYVVTLLFAAAATAFLIAPVAYHRIVFRHQQKDDLVRDANRMALAGIGCLLVAMVGAVLLILEVTLGQPAATTLAIAVAAFFLLWWVVFPVVSRTRDELGD